MLINRIFRIEDVWLVIPRVIHLFIFVMFIIIYFFFVKNSKPLESRFSFSLFYKIKRTKFKKSNSKHTFWVISAVSSLFHFIFEKKCNSMCYCCSFFVSNIYSRKKFILHGISIPYQLSECYKRLTWMAGWIYVSKYNSI